MLNMNGRNIFVTGYVNASELHHVLSSFIKDSTVQSVTRVCEFDSENRAIYLVLYVYD